MTCTYSRDPSPATCSSTVSKGLRVRTTSASSRRYFSARAGGKKSKSVLPRMSARARPVVAQKRPLPNVNRPARSLRKMFCGSDSTSEWYSASDSRSASSARFRSEMSREMPKVPTTRPSESRSGIFVVSTHPSVPSGRVSFSSLPTTGRPVRMISRSSSNAGRACSSVKTSKSVLPATAAGSPRPRCRAIARLTRRNRLRSSLK